jgi:transcriptional accessory protein Tex/SPT6
MDRSCYEQVHHLHRLLPLVSHQYEYRLCREYNVELIAIGNGTASRETEAVVAEMMAANTFIFFRREWIDRAMSKYITCIAYYR